MIYNSEPSTIRSLSLDETYEVLDELNAAIANITAKLEYSDDEDWRIRAIHARQHMMHSVECCRERISEIKSQPIEQPKRKLTAWLGK